MIAELRRVRTWSGFDPHRSHTSSITSYELDRNRTNPLRSCPHYQLNLWRFIHKAQLLSYDSVLATHCYTVLFLDIPSSWLWTLSSPYIQQRVRFLYSPTTTWHLLQTHASINKCACHVITSFLVIIHFQSRSNPPEVDWLDHDPITIGLT